MPVLMCDIECYKNYFLIGFLDWETRVLYQYKAWDVDPLSDNRIEEILRLLNGATIVTFNGIRYDMPLISAALAGVDCEQLKKYSDMIIQENMWPWQFTRQTGIHVLEPDHIDLIEVLPGMNSLKLYAGRLHTRKMQDLPYEHTSIITPEMASTLESYNANDLIETGECYDHMQDQIQLRRDMSHQYDIDLRSKSDAQIAEAVITHEVAKLTGKQVKKPQSYTGQLFRYNPPRIIQFKTSYMQEILDMVKGTMFEVAKSGQVKMPDELSDLKITIGNSTYTMGIGGLHSNEKKISHYADANRMLIDRDVASYYPRIILEQGLYPKHIGPAFTKVYEQIVERRLEAKAAGDKVTANSLKIVINGSFGKFGSMYSKLYAPPLLIQTTITGQLALLMLIEEMEENGIPVVSANTDGIVMHPLREDYALLNDIVWGWEQCTGYDTEETMYKSLHSRDVNSYMAITLNEQVKLKGNFATVGSSFYGVSINPANEICIEAVKQYLLDETPIHETIYFADDLRDFVTVKKVAGGGKWVDLLTGEEQYLGKAVRWYYGKNPDTKIEYVSNGNKVGRSDGAMPCMTIDDWSEIPEDLDREWYCREAEDMLKQMGVK